MEFSLKPITFFGRTCVIICQNENGPCPLLAIANILLLQNRITVNPDRGILPLAELIQIVANAILEKIGVDKFEFTEEISVFDALGIRLLHGWLCNPDEAEEAAVLGEMSYNHVLFRLVEYKSLSAKQDNPNSTATEEKEPDGDLMSSAKDGCESPAKTSPDHTTLQYEGAVLERFLQKTASQFTYHGMLALYNAMQDRQFAVFFRNNHFSALYFYNGQLFTLVTDLGYRHESTVVWELLNSIDGDCEFYNSEFAPLSSLAPISSPGFFSNFPDVHAAVPTSPGASSGGPHPGRGTIAAPPVGYKFAPTTCAPPVTAQSSSPVSPVSAQAASDGTTGSGSEGDNHGPGVMHQSDGVSITAGVDETAENMKRSANAPPSAGAGHEHSQQLPDLTCAPATTCRAAELIAAEEDSYEVVDANLLVSPTPDILAPGAVGNGNAGFAATVTEPALCEKHAAHTASVDEEVHIPSVTQPLPAGVPATSPVAGAASGAAQAVFAAAARAATASSYDDDLRLAMELQAQEDAHARTLAMANSHWSAPTQETTPHTSASVPAPQDVFLSQEESDRQHALMLHYQQVEAQEQELQRLQQQRQLYQQQQRPAAAATAPVPAQRYTTYAGSSSGGFPYNQSNERRRSGSSSGKKDSCCIS